MKKYILLLTITYISQLIMAQVPNGSFESWTAGPNYEIPTEWESNQDTTYIRVQKDSLSTNGNYSLKLSSNVGSGFFDCSTRVNTSFDFEEPITDNKNISFFLKTSPDDPEFIFFSAVAFYYTDGELQSQGSFEADEIYEEFTQINMDDIPLGIDSIGFYIFAGALNGADDGCYNHTTSWVDDVKINQSLTANKEIIKNDLEIYPNPSSGIINIRQESNEFTEYRIVNIVGKEIQRGSLANNKIEIEKSGPYILQLFSSKGASYDIVRKVIIE